MIQKQKANISILFANIIFGANYWIAKGLMPYYLHPLQIIFLRVGFTAILFWIFQLLSTYERVEKKDLLKLSFYSFLGVAVNQTMFFKGLNLTTPVDASIIQTSGPILVLLFSGIIIKEKITLVKSIGILLGALGAILLILHGKQISLNSETLKGNIFIMVCISAYGLYLVLVKPLMAKYKTITVMKWIFLFGFIYIIPFSINKMHYINWQNFTALTWFSLLYVIILTTFIAYLLTIYSLKFLSPTIVGFYIYLQPIIAAGIGIFIFNKSLTIDKIISASLIFVGVYLVNKKNPVLI